MWPDFDCVLRSYSDDEDEYEQQLEEDIIIWLDFCQMTDRAVRDYIRNARQRIRRNPRARNGHMFMIEALDGDGQISYQEFRMCPDAFIRFTHVLRDEHGLHDGTEVTIYEQVDMFLCILAHGKGYRQVRTMFGHSLQTIGHYFKLVLRAVVQLGGRLIKPDPNYNLSPPHHRRKANKHPLFKDCIGAIDGKVVLPQEERLNFIGRKGIPTQNVLAACDFNLCFTFVLPSSTGNTHNSRILTRAIYSPDINFPTPGPGKYYLVDSGFANRPAVVVATMMVHNFLRKLGQIDQAFDSVESNRNHDEIDMPDEQDEIAVEMNAPQNQNMTWDELCDYMAQRMR
ncbi:hypothetical protein Adt_34229 [Abeliophyllum distichum]|uniref:EF-hand domain-containing protein n=1 Tax=Abeliophyllum distichum TaxID=126358 RepID=A0ABD1QYI1_9LAMI